jgi:agmatine deiminase
MPAEWYRHDATWVSWPHNRDTWPTNLPAAQREFVQLVHAIATDEPVAIMAGREMAEEVRSAIDHLESRGNIWIANLPTNDAWARDYAPTFVINHQLSRIVAVNWQYNAWGGKYPPFDDDRLIARRMMTQFPDEIRPVGGCGYHPVDLIMEGGAIEIDESGVLLCTRSCVLNANRNPGVAVADVEREFMDTLGATRVVWLSGDAIVGDDTDGHIDQLARFAPGGKIVYAWTNDATDPQRTSLESNLADLLRACTELSLNYDLVPLPLPNPVMLNGNRLPASYCNFYITNRSVLVPQFDQPQDAAARIILGKLFPERRIVGCPSINLSVGLGSFHCLTQQQPSLAV